MKKDRAIENRLVQEAQRLGSHRTKKAAIFAALDEYVRRRRQQKVLALFGTIEYDERCDHQKERQSRE